VSASGYCRPRRLLPSWMRLPGSQPLSPPPTWSDIEVRSLGTLVCFTLWDVAEMFVQC
jgi:hypothetical protein